MSRDQDSTPGTWQPAGPVVAATRPVAVAGDRRRRGIEIPPPPDQPAAARVVLGGDTA